VPAKPQTNPSSSKAPSALHLFASAESFDNPEVIHLDSGHHPSEIHIGSLEGIGPGAWKTAEGIATGTSLLQLEKLNGHAFHLAGFAWDYSGTVTSWDGGRLAPLRVGGVKLSLDPGPRLEPALARKLYEQVQGDGFFPSSHPAMQALNPRVSLIVFLFSN